MRQRKLLIYNLLQCQSRTRMSLTYQGMTLHTLPAQYLCSQYAVTDVRFCTTASYGRRIYPHDTDIVQHGSLFDKGLVSFQLGMLASYLQSLVCYSSTVSH